MESGLPQGTLCLNGVLWKWFRAYEDQLGAPVSMRVPVSSGAVSYQSASRTAISRAPSSRQARRGLSPLSPAARRHSVCVWLTGWVALAVWLCGSATLCATLCSSTLHQTTASATPCSSTLHQTTASATLCSSTLHQTTAVQPSVAVQTVSTSGARYSGVPHTVNVLSLVMRFEKPNSMSFK